MRRKLEAAIEAEIRRMLGLWVSECEPGLAWGPEGLLGLTLAGDSGPARIVVPSRLTTLRDCLSAIEDNSDLSVPAHPPATLADDGAPAFRYR